MILARRRALSVVIPLSIMEGYSRRTHRVVITRGLYFFMASVGLLLLSLPVHAAEQKPVVAVAPVKSVAVASGAVEDTLATCLTRIPQEATAGQRLIC